MTDPAAEDGNTESVLSVNISTPGKVFLSGDFVKGDEIRLYSREYRSAKAMITDKLLVETTADKDGTASFLYNLQTPPLSETEIKPDFEYAGKDVVITALFAVAMHEDTELRSGLAYVSGYLDTGVVNQYWCTYGGSTACGSAAGAIILQMVYPVYGDDMYTRVNTMRNYCMEGSDYCTGYPMYENVGEQITNTVNRYVNEELEGGLLLSNHRVPDKTTEETLIELLTTGRPAVIEVCYLRGFVMEDYWGYSHFITINGFFLDGNGYWFRYSDPVTVSYASVSSDLIEKSNKNVSYRYLPGYTYDRYIAAFEEPLFSIE
ncbi:MAG: hypothetical protein IKP86_06340 [Anaerolineaceae bacterium]|nr:hypothetical protein [Anaerolineaceae bacterium]